jgi:hypothetical protein
MKRVSQILNLNSIFMSASPITNLPFNLMGMKPERKICMKQENWTTRWIVYIIFIMNKPIYA